jgi:hypothetical protein
MSMINIVIRGILGNEDFLRKESRETGMFSCWNNSSGV